MDSISRQAPLAAGAFAERITGLMSAQELTLLVYRQMRAFTGPHRDLEDLAQTALEQLLHADFQGQAKVSTFTHSVCYRIWMKHLRFTYRFRSRFVPADTEELESGIETANPGSLLEDRRRFARLYEALAKLSAKRGAVVTLHDVAGLDVAEIAAVVGTNEATVRTRLRDGRKKLRTLLARDPEFARVGEEPSPQRKHQELPCPQS